MTLTSRGWTALDLVIELLRNRPNIQLQDPCDKEPKSNIVSYWKIFGQKSTKQISETKRKEIYSNHKYKVQYQTFKNLRNLNL